MSFRSEPLTMPPRRSLLRGLTRCGASACAATLAVFLLTSYGAEKNNPLENATTHAILAGDWKSALAHGKKWAAEDSRNPVVHYLLNMAYTYTGNRDQA